METDQLNKERSIGEVAHKSIRDAGQLYIYTHSSNKFELYSKDNFPMTNCPICPDRFVKAHQNYSSCNFTTTNWCTFKTHLNRAEKMYGELIAFTSLDQIPTVNKFEKFKNYRIYGDIHKYKELDKFYVYDPQDKQFNLFEQKNNLRKKFIKNNKCFYCKCDKSVIFWDTLLDHIALIEKRQHCYLILDDLKYNDEMNQNKINYFFNNLKNLSEKLDQSIADSDSDIFELNKRKKSKPNPLSIESDESNDSKIKSNNHKTIQNKKIFKSNSEDNLKMDKLAYSNALNNIINTFKRHNQEIEDFRIELQNNCFNRNEQISLDDQIIKNQQSFKLVEKKEIFNNKEIHIQFSKKSNLKENDLIKLLNEKYKNLNNYKIKDAEIILSLKCLDSNQKQISNTDNLQSSINQPSTSSSSNLTNLKQNSFPLIKSLSADIAKDLQPIDLSMTSENSTNQTQFVKTTFMKSNLNSNLNHSLNQSIQVNLGPVDFNDNLSNNNLIADLKKENSSFNLNTRSYSQHRNELGADFLSCNSDFDQYLSQISQPKKMNKKLTDDEKEFSKKSKLN